MTKQTSTSTPGPWTLEAGTPDRRLQDRINGADGMPVAYTAVIRFEGTTGKQAQLDKFHEASANARLIAAAPELAEALRWLVEIHDEWADKQNSLDWAISQARTALAKAGL